MESGISLYVHIPFCEVRCAYCDFNAYQGKGHLAGAYVEALTHEILRWGQFLAGPRVQTIFFGGGTPSQLPIESLERISHAVQDAFVVAPDAEVTLEANPGDLTPPYLRQLRSTFVNRLSIGFQSLHDPDLRFLGRRHDASQARKAYLAARQAGFDNVNLDFIFAIPGQTLDVWRSNLVQALELAPEHLSLYCLTIEEHTPLWKLVEFGKVREADPDLAADMYLLAEDLLGQAGYQHYEISNWARPGRESRHNLTYWKAEPYLGVGCGAHSYLNGHRFSNALRPESYIKRMKSFNSGVVLSSAALDEAAIRRVAPIDQLEPPNARQERADAMILGLRLMDGVDQTAFAKRFGDAPAAVWDSELEELAEMGLVEQQGDFLRLTLKGRLLGNEVFLRFLP